jgi:hypothetical protein
MYLQRAVQQAFRLGLLVTLVVLALGACGGDSQEQANKPRLLPEYEKALRPGVYRSEEFKPSLSFQVGKGWSTSPPELSDALSITRGETGGLGFSSAKEVYKPTRTGTPVVVEAPEDMIGWFQHHPYLQTSKPEPVTVGGVEGEQFDVVVGDLPEGYLGVCGRDCVATLIFSDGTRLGIYPQDKLRLIVLEDVNGERVVMGFGGPASEFDEHAIEAQKVIDTVEWTGS